MIEDDSENEANNTNTDLKGDIYTIKNSARKNTVNLMEFENGKHFMTGKSTVKLQVDNTQPISATGPNNVHTLKLSLLKMQPVPTDSSPKDGVNLTAQISPRDGSRNR